MLWCIGRWNNNLTYPKGERTKQRKREKIQVVPHNSTYTLQYTVELSNTDNAYEADELLIPCISEEKFRFSIFLAERERERERENG